METLKGEAPIAESRTFHIMSLLPINAKKYLILIQYVMPGSDVELIPST